MIKTRELSHAARSKSTPNVQLHFYMPAKGVPRGNPGKDAIYNIFVKKKTKNLRDEMSTQKTLQTLLREINDLKTWRQINRFMDQKI